MIFATDQGLVKIEAAAGLRRPGDQSLVDAVMRTRGGPEAAIAAAAGQWGFGFPAHPDAMSVHARAAWLFANEWMTVRPLHLAAREVAYIAGEGNSPEDLIEDAVEAVEDAFSDVRDRIADALDPDRAEAPAAAEITPPPPRPTKPGEQQEHCNLEKLIVKERFSIPGVKSGSGQFTYDPDKTTFNPETPLELPSGWPIAVIAHSPNGFPDSPPASGATELEFIAEVEGPCQLDYHPATRGRRDDARVSKGGAPKTRFRDNYPAPMRGAATGFVGGKISAVQFIRSIGHTVFAAPGGATAQADSCGNPGGGATPCQSLQSQIYIFPDDVITLKISRETPFKLDEKKSEKTKDWTFGSQKTLGNKEKEDEKDLPIEFSAEIESLNVKEEVDFSEFFEWIAFAEMVFKNFSEIVSQIKVGAYCHVTGNVAFLIGSIEITYRHQYGKSANTSSREHPWIYRSVMASFAIKLLEAEIEIKAGIGISIPFVGTIADANISSTIAGSVDIFEDIEILSAYPKRYRPYASLILKEPEPAYRGEITGKIAITAKIWSIGADADIEARITAAAKIVLNDSDDITSQIEECLLHETKAAVQVGKGMLSYTKEIKVFDSYDWVANGKVGDILA